MDRQKKYKGYSIGNKYCKSINKQEDREFLKKEIKKSIEKLNKEILFFEENISLPIKNLKFQRAQKKRKKENIQKLQLLEEEITDLNSKLYPQENKNISKLIRKETKVQKEIKKAEEKTKEINKIKNLSKSLKKDIENIDKKITEAKKKCPTQIANLRLGPKY